MQFNMFNSIKQCYFHNEEHYFVVGGILTVVSIASALYTFVINVFALIGIWLAYKQKLTRTPKLLLSLFATNLMVVFALVSLSMCHFIDDFHRSWLFSAHISVIVFLVLWSSTNLCLVTLDRYLLLVHGSRHQLLKESFMTCVFAQFVAVAGYSIIIYLGFKFMGCTVNLINLSGIVAFFSFNLCMSLVINIRLVRYIRMNTLIIERSNTMQRGLSKTLTAMTICDDVFLVLLIIVLVIFICSVTLSSGLSKFGPVILVSLSFLSLFKCGTVSLTYIFSNKKVIKALC